MPVFINFHSTTDSTRASRGVSFHFDVPFSFYLLNYVATFAFHISGDNIAFPSSVKDVEIHGMVSSR